MADKSIPEIIQREIDDIKSKLDGLARNALLAAIDAFEVNTVALATEMGKVELTELNEETKRALSHAKKRFKMAREEARWTASKLSDIASWRQC